MARRRPRNPMDQAKSSIEGAINFMITCIVLFVYFIILCQIRLPHLKVFVYALEPHSAFVGGWLRVVVILWIIFAVLMCFIVWMWILWKIINKFVPKKILFFKVRSRILAIPPFPQMERAGLFALCDGLYDAIVARTSFGHRLQMFGSTFANFIRTNTYMVMALIGGDDLQDLTSGHVWNVAEPEDTEPEVVRDESPFTGSNYSQVDEEYQQCLEENIVPVSPDMSSDERTEASTKNRQAKVTCQLQGISIAMRTGEFDF